MGSCGYTDVAAQIHDSHVHVVTLQAIAHGVMGSAQVDRRPAADAFLPLSFQNHTFQDSWSTMLVIARLGPVSPSALNGVELEEVRQQVSVILF